MSKYYEPWINFTIPFKKNSLDQCNRYEVINFNEKIDMCFEENFDKNRFKNCHSEFIFRDREVTISNDFGIYCDDEWKLSMVGTVNNIGQFIGIPLGGFIADKYGRRTVLATGGFFSAIMGTIRSYSPNYIFFLIFELFDMVVGSTLFATVFILAVELVSPNKRVLVCSIITMVYAFGEVLLAATAKYIQNWRIILRILYIPAFIHIFYFWILNESVRWLLSQKKEMKAKKILKKTFANISESNLEKIISNNRNKLKTTTNENQFSLFKAIQLLFWRICNCSFCWFTHTLIALGLSLNSVNLNGNKYHNFMLSALITIPGMLLPFLIVDRIGRRYSLCGSMLICGFCIAASIFIGKEIFPTNVRNSLLAICSMIGRFGSMVAPQTPIIAKYYTYAPQILFSSFALLSGALTLFFPETTNKVLPTTMEEASMPVTKQKTNKSDIEMF